MSYIELGQLKMYIYQINNQSITTKNSQELVKQWEEVRKMYESLTDSEFKLFNKQEQSEC